MQNAFRLVQAIESWKAHQPRSLQQDKAKSTALESLDEPWVLITQDWAMKSPKRYRETQAERHLLFGEVQAHFREEYHFRYR